MQSLEIKNLSKEQKESILKFAIENRRFEIERFWHRSIFFWGFIAAAFVAYATLYSQQKHNIALLIACFGGLCSLAWSLQNQGSKYWQEVWEQKVADVEIEVLGISLFSSPKPLQEKGLFGARRYSVSKLAIALSYLTVVIWTLLVLSSVVESWKYSASIPIALIVGTIIGAALLLTMCRSSPD